MIDNKGKLPMTKEIESDNNGIPTIVLGDGNTIIGELIHDDYSGICFSKGAGAVGDLHPEVEGKMDHEIGVYFKIITDNPDSIQVLIDRLEGAKKRIKGLSHERKLQND